MILQRVAKKIWKNTMVPATLLGKMILAFPVSIISLLVLTIAVCEIVLLDIPLVIVLITEGWGIRSACRSLSYI